ncbi:MAG: LysR family transcriptional regulator [Isosphaeraceae bacterium]
MSRAKLDRAARRGSLANLRSFCFAAQLGSISRAAELASLSQPTVSLQIQALEIELNVSLFQRKGPRISLTPEGQALFEMARPLVEGIDGLPAAFQARRLGLVTGRLNIAAGESTILYLLPGILRDFSRRHPGIDIKLHNVSGREGLRMLRNDSVDLAVGSLVEVPEDLTYEPAFTFDPVLITARGHPLSKLKRVSIKDVAAYPLILPPQQLTTWRVVDYVFHKYRLSYRVALEAGGWEVIKKYVELDVGVSVVTGICLTGSEALETVPFHRYFPRRTYGVILRKGKLPPTSTQQFLELVRDEAKRRQRGRRARGVGDDRAGRRTGRPVEDETAGTEDGSIDD